jgi:hypothetical protein
MNPRGYLATATMFGTITALPFGLLFSLLTNIPVEAGLIAGIFFGLLFGPFMAIFFRGMRVRLPATNARFDGLLQQAMAEFGYYLESQIGSSMTFKPSFQAGLLAGRITITKAADGVDVFGPAFYVKKLNRKFSNASAFGIREND